MSASRASPGAGAASPSGSPTVRPDPAPGPGDGAPSARPRLLLVEDDPTTAKALSGIFRRRGWEVREVRSVAQALDCLAPAPNCAILDLMLPDGNGLAVLETIRAQNLPTRVAVTTGSNDLAKLRAVAALRPDVFLHKPICLADLLEGLGIKP